MNKIKGFSAICIALAMCTLVACGESAKPKGKADSKSAQSISAQNTPQQSYKSVQGFAPKSGTVPNQTNVRPQTPTKTTTTTRRYNTPTQTPTNPYVPNRTNTPAPSRTNTPTPSKTNSPQPNALVPINTPFLNDCQKVLNQKRSAAGLGSVTADANLTKLAEVRVKEVSKKFSHTRPDGRDAKSVFGDHKIPMPDWRAENIATAIKFNDAADIFSVWMGSKDHKANLLNSKAKRFGMANYTGSDGKMYSVIILAS